MSQSMSGGKIQAKDFILKCDIIIKKKQLHIATLRATRKSQEENLRCYQWKFALEPKWEYKFRNLCQLSTGGVFELSYLRQNVAHAEEFRNTTTGMPSFTHNTSCMESPRRITATIWCLHIWVQLHSVHLILFIAPPNISLISIKLGNAALRKNTYHLKGNVCIILNCTYRPLDLKQRGLLWDAKISVKSNYIYIYINQLIHKLKSIRSYQWWRHQFEHSDSDFDSLLVMPWIALVRLIPVCI